MDNIIWGSGIVAFYCLGWLIGFFTCSIIRTADEAATVKAARKVSTKDLYPPRD